MKNVAILLDDLAMASKISWALRENGIFPAIFRSKEQWVDDNFQLIITAPSLDLDIPWYRRVLLLGGDESVDPPLSLGHIVNTQNLTVQIKLILQRFEVMAKMKKDNLSLQIITDEFENRIAALQDKNKEQIKVARTRDMQLEMISLAGVNIGKNFISSCQNIFTAHAAVVKYSILQLQENIWQKVDLADDKYLKLSDDFNKSDLSWLKDSLMKSFNQPYAVLLTITNHQLVVDYLIALSLQEEVAGSCSPLENYLSTLNSTYTEKDNYIIAPHRFISLIKRMEGYQLGEISCKNIIHRLFQRDDLKFNWPYFVEYLIKKIATLDNVYVAPWGMDRIFLLIKKDAMTLENIKREIARLPIWKFFNKRELDISMLTFTILENNPFKRYDYEI